jgi:ParB family chromosome partitioning protein
MIDEGQCPAEVRLNLMVRALTLATPAQQADWLNLWNSDTERAPLGRACRAWITGGSAITTDKALFDLAGYTGAVTADLFGETAVFADAAAFWEAQGAAIASYADTQSGPVSHLVAARVNGEPG